MLPKNIMLWSFHRTILSESYCPNHGNQQKKRPHHQQRRMNPIKSNSQRSDWSGGFPPFCPKRSIILRKHRYRGKKRCSAMRRIFQSKPSSPKKTQGLDSSHRVTSTLMCQNFSRWNIQKHHNKQKQNSQCTNIHQQLQQHKIFKSKQN